MDLGAPPLRTFLTITLPLILPAIAAGWMLAFSLSLDDLVIASFTTGPGATTLPIRIYSQVRLGVKPEINAICTIMIAVVGVATVLGTSVALALARIGRFTGRTALSAMTYAPLVMPEVIIGLSLLLLFVAVGFDRGFWTVTVAHTTLTMCFVTIIVQARLADMDRNLEEAAMDLGCPPLRTLLAVTLPLAAPAVISGFLLAFSLSLDDLVIASFTTGPGATTLPIRIYSEVRLGVKPEINAICTLMIAAVSVAVVLAALLERRRAG